MIQLTENAVKAVRRFIRGSETPDAGLRLTITGGGCSGLQYEMALDREAAPEDTVIDCGGGLRVLIDGQSAPLLDGVTIDFVDGLAQSGFTFENPNATATCGCGTSFSA